MIKRLTELIRQAEQECLEMKICSRCEQYGRGGDCQRLKIANHLLKNGVIAPPCDVGDKVFFVHDMCDENGKEGYMISEGKVCGISKDESTVWIFCRYDGGLTYYHTAEEFGIDVFLMRMGAEKALAERSENGK